MNELIIPININAETIRMLISELNDNQNSDMCIFIEDILKKTDIYTQNLLKKIEDIRKENPFSADNETEFKGENK